MPRFTNDPILQSFIRTNLIKTTKLNLELVLRLKLDEKRKAQFHTTCLKNIRLLLSRSHDQSPFPVEGENLWL